MPLPLGWLLGGLGNIITKGVADVAAGVAKSAGVDVKQLLKPSTVADITPEGVLTATLSTIGGIIGSPLGLLPAMMLLYHAGRGQEHIQAASRTFLPGRIPPETFARLFFKDIITPENYDVWLKDLLDQGWSKERVTALTESYRMVMGLGEIRDAFLRGFYGEGDAARQKATQKIQSHGFTSEDAGHIIDLFYYLPTPGEVMRWAAREVFEPELRKKYRIDEDLPPEFLDWAGKVGITGEVAKNYWAAHWELPSFMNIVEMWHRGVIEEKDVDDFFVELDMVPYWREQLKKIAFMPFTRVDVRRMYRIGVLSPAEVVRAYMDIGYTKENAEKLLEFTEKYYPIEDDSDDADIRQLTKAEILKGYHELVLDQDTAMAGLMSIDYSEDIAGYLITLEDVKLASEYVTDAIKYISAAFKAGRLSVTELVGKLGELNLSGVEIDYYRDKLIKEETEKIARPSLSDFKRWLKLEIITQAVFRNELAIAGYTTEHVNNYIAEIKAAPISEVVSE